MARRKKIKEKIVLHPVMTFIFFIIITILLSGLLSLFNLSFAYNAISESRLEYVAASEAVNSLLNLSGIKYIFSNTVANFANFTVLSHLIIILLGVGVMEYSGFLKTAVGFFTRKAKKNTFTYVIVLFSIVASILGNLPFIAFIPLVGLIYKYGKRNPLTGIIASFAGMTCGYGLSLFLTSVDSSLADITMLSASLLDPAYSFKSFSMLFIMFVAIIILSFIITAIVEGYTVRKVPKYDFVDTEVLSDEPLTKAQQKGLLLALFGSVAYLIIFIYNIIPGLPFSGNFLNYSENLYIDKLFGAESFFANGFVFIITILFVILGLLYGIGAKTIRNNREFVEALGHSLNGIGKVLIYIFASATFISIFKQTNLGNVIVAGLTKLVTDIGLSGIGLVIMLFVITAVITLAVPGSTAKWSIMATSVVPAFLNAGMSAEFAQIIFRFGECVTIGLTPLFSYFIIYLAYLEKYNQEENNMSIMSAVRYQIPYSLATAGVLLAILIIWYLVGLPLGINGSIAI